MFYLIVTPIGNSEDITLRAVKILTSSDIILCEDTRSFNNFYEKMQQLLQIFPKTSQKLLPFHKNNEYQELPRILTYLKTDQNVALVSESGMPTISDPGSLLLQQVIKEQIPYTVIPGPTAFVNALVLSGFTTDKVLFLGFLPKKKSQLLQLFNQLKYSAKFAKQLTVAFYESPYRINDTLLIIDEVFTTAQICICREMTKKFEEIMRGTAKELADKTYKGEITVLIKIDI